jgi:hypothetical protein
VQNEVLLSCLRSRDLTQHCNLPRLLLVLIKAGASVLEKNVMRQSKITSFINGLYSASYRHDARDRVRILSILIKKGVGVSDICDRGLSPSMYAQHFLYWDLWSQALQRAGKLLCDVVRAEGNAWLPDNDWRKVWKARHYH